LPQSNYSADLLPKVCGLKGWIHPASCPQQIPQSYRMAMAKAGTTKERVMYLEREGREADDP